MKRGLWQKQTPLCLFFPKECHRKTKETSRPFRTNRILLSKKNNIILCFWHIPCRRRQGSFFLFALYSLPSSRCFCGWCPSTTPKGETGVTTGMQSCAPPQRARRGCRCGESWGPPCCPPRRRPSSCRTGPGPSHVSTAGGAVIHWSERNAVTAYCIQMIIFCLWYVLTNLGSLWINEAGQWGS